MKGLVSISHTDNLLRGLNRSPEHFFPLSTEDICIVCVSSTVSIMQGIRDVVNKNKCFLLLMYSLVDRYESHNNTDEYAITTEIRAEKRKIPGFIRACNKGT